MPHLPHHRPDERRRLKALLLSGASILMLAPRRVGKTWLLQKIDDDMTAAGWLCVRIDVEGIESEEDFLRTLCRGIEGKQDIAKTLLAQLTQRFKQVSVEIGPTGLVGAIGKVNHREFIETLVASLDGENRKTLILIDEIALYVLRRARQDAESTRSLLYHLRKLQQKYRNVQWFLTGSVGLDVVARRHDMLGAIVDYDAFPLEPFSEEVALSYIGELVGQNLVGAPFDFADGAFEHLVRELGWLSPYHLRHIALQIKPTENLGMGAGRRFAAIADVDRAMEKLLSVPFRFHFAVWEEHIKKNFDVVESNHLKAILAIASETSAGEIEATFLSRLSRRYPNFGARALRDMLSCLAADGYLVNVDGRWKFQSGLLRRYWRKYIAE